MSASSLANMVAASVDLGGTKIYGALLDGTGSARHEYRVPTYVEGTPPLDQLIHVIDHLLKQPLRSGQRMVGIGVGVPGITSRDGESVSFAPALGWTDVPVRRILRERFALPVYVENDVNLAALGEYGFGAGQDADSLICIAVGTGIGSGIVLGGRLYRGHTVSAGEIGYMLPGVDFLGRRYDDFGALEGAASGTGITRRAQARLRSIGDESRAAAITAQDVIAAASAEAWAREVVDETIDVLTLCIVNVTSVLDPEVVILSGGVMSAADTFIPEIQRRMQGSLPFIPRIAASSLGARATTLGAAQLVLSSQTP